jgi:hypothetical protein
MKYRTRTYYSAEQKAEMWDRWQQASQFTRLPGFLTGSTRRFVAFLLRQAGYGHAN